jgi:hypothetical protein
MEPKILPKPQRIFFAMVLKALGQVGIERGTRAESILRHMLQLHEQHQLETKHNAICYSSVMNCCANSGYPGAAEKALTLLREMQALWEQGDQTMRPNVICYNMVMSALCQKRSNCRGRSALEGNVLGMFNQWK